MGAHAVGQSEGGCVLSAISITMRDVSSGDSYTKRWLRHSVLIHFMSKPASAVRPEMPTPTWSSMRKTFSWYDASSFGRLRRATAASPPVRGPRFP